MVRRTRASATVLLHSSPMQRRELNAGQQRRRERLRGLGLLLAVSGAVFTAVGLIDFFSEHDSFGGPRRFWCLFVGVPLLGFGTHLLKIGYLGVMARHVAGEVAPVTADVIDYVAKETRESLQSTARAMAAVCATTARPRPCRAPTVATTTSGAPRSAISAASRSRRRRSAGSAGPRTSQTPSSAKPAASRTPSPRSRPSSAIAAAG